MAASSPLAMSSREQASNFQLWGASAFPGCSGLSGVLSCPERHETYTQTAFTAKGACRGVQCFRHSILVIIA